METEKEKTEKAIEDIRDDPEYQSEVQRVASLMKQKGVLERNAPEQDQKRFMVLFFCCGVLALVMLVLRLLRFIPLIVVDAVFGGILLVCLIIMGIRKNRKERKRRR